MNHLGNQRLDQRVRMQRDSLRLPIERERLRKVLVLALTLIKKLQTQNHFVALQEEPSPMDGEKDQATQKASEEKLSDPKQVEKAPTQELIMEDRTTAEEDTKVEDMILGDLDLDGLEAAFTVNNPKDISPQQVNLLEKAIIISKTSKNLGV